VLCDIDFLAPAGLAFVQTDQYDPNPRPRITLREWHLTASAPQKSRQIEFVTLYRIHRSSQSIPRTARLVPLEGGYGLEAACSFGEVTALLPTAGDHPLRALGLTTPGPLKVRLKPDNGPARILTVE